jgi:hypothetical protein
VPLAHDAMLMAVVRLQAFLTRLLTVDLPGLMVLPLRLEIGIPPGLTSVAEAAVGRDAVMRAVASAVLQVLLSIERLAVSSDGCIFASPFHPAAMLLHVSANAW